MGVIDNEKQRIIRPSSEKQRKQSEDSEEDTYEKKRGCKDVLRSIGRYFWDSETKEFLGRTGKSWALILLFYVVFYGLLVVMFVIMLEVFLATISTIAPTLQGFESLLKNHPGMGFRPMPFRTFVSFTTADNLTYARAVKGLDAFLQRYQSQNDSRYVDCTDGVPPAPGTLCRFNMTTLGPCTAATSYGYPEGKPCILLKLNKIYGWTPQNLTDPSMLEEYYNSTSFTARTPTYDQHIPLTCEGEFAADRDNIGTVKIYPPDGLPFSFYPYLNQPGYLAPIAMAQFENLRPGTVILVWCKAWADNIYHDRADQAGSVRFELLVDR